MKMNFAQFTEEIVNKIREFLPESFANASVELQTVTKNNSLTLTGLTIRSTNNICPTIYLEKFYDNYQSGEEMEKILSDIADLRIRNEVRDVFDVEQVTDFSRVANAIVPHLINKEWNLRLLEQRPYTEVADDLAVTYHIMLKQDFDGAASVPITYALMQGWGVDVNTLHDLAIKNMSVLMPSTFQSMSSVLGEMLYKDMDEEDRENLLSDMLPQDDFMFVLSNKQRMFGAAAVLDKNIMKAVVDRFGKDFYICPSSTHELIIVSAPEGVNTEEISELIQSVNENEVSQDDKLGTHPYRYTVEEGLLSI